MANLMMIVDYDAERRSQFIQTITPKLALVPGLTTQIRQWGDFATVWAANPQAPISWNQTPTAAAIVWGTAFAGTHRVDASDLQQQWGDGHPANFPAFDGYYAAAIYSQARGLTVGADVLGIFPIYYYRNHEITLVGTSPELFQYHPVFQKRFNPAGLVSLLLTNTITHGEALWQDVRRLDHGHLLIDAPGQLPREIQHYTIPEGKYCAEYAQLSFDEQVALLEETLDRAISQQIEPNGNLTLMLSGGLDSRTLAGLLHRQQVTPQALTLGRRSDLEAACAATVARELGFTQHLIDISPKQFPAYGQIVTQWEHLTGSFSFSSGWGLFSALHKLAPRVMAGYSLDLVLGGPVPDRLFLKPVPFDQFFDCGVNRLGFSPARLTQLLNPSVFGNAVQTSLEKLQFRYENYADTAFRRALRFKLHHRQRLYIGMNAWRLCFGAWPVLPFLNQQLLAVSASMPALTLDSRRAQKAMLCRAFPNLARLPLDRNSYSTAPLQANSLALFDPLSAQWRRLQKKLGFERRYYYRTFDINNIGWQILRRQIEPLRAYAGEFFEPDQFDAWVPPPGNRIRAQEPIGGVNGIRNLLGFLWWAEQHL